MIIRYRRYFPVVLPVLCVVCGHGTGIDPDTYEVKREKFEVTLTVTGELTAVNSKMIVSPMSGWEFGLPKIIELVEDGKHVEEGDVVARFDGSEIQKGLADAQTELEVAEAEKAKLLATQRSELEDLEADLKIAELSHNISKIELDQAQYKAEIDRKKIELDLQKSDINLAKARREIEDKRKVHQEDLSKAELKVHQAKTKVEQARETLDKLTITAPAPGIAVIRKNYSTDLKFQTNDAPYPGYPIIELPDLSQVQANVMVNEVDIAKIMNGQKAKVVLDAFPDTSFTGEVTKVAILARNKNRNSQVKVFDTEVLLNGSHAKFLPGMTVSCDIIVETFNEVLFVPLEAIHMQQGEPVVYLQNGGTPEMKQVRTGAENKDFVIIEEGVSEGDKVLLVDPTQTTQNEKPGLSGEPK